MVIKKIISGGQTGVDRAALDCAMEIGLECGGWCPKGRMAEDGRINKKYPLKETPRRDYNQRTEWNVRDSDGTLVLSFGKPSGGTLLTIQSAKTLGRPFLIVDLKSDVETASFRSWLQSHNIHTLNVAGPRESLAPGDIYRLARIKLATLLQKHPRIE